MAPDPAHHPTPSRSRPPRHTLVLGLILLVAVGLRLANYARLADGPCLLHHGVSDMAFFAEWSERIATGRTDEPIHPLHSWHRTVAVDYLTRHPEVIGGADIRQLGSVERDRHARALWDTWYGGLTFHQEPLYPYGLALVRSLCGPEPRWVHLGQMLLGVLGILLVHALAKRYFGAPAALLAAGMAALCGPLLFFELHLLRAAPIAFATLALALLFERTADAPTPRRLLLFGLGTGIALTLKAHFLVFGVLAVALLLWRSRPGWRGGGRQAGLVAAGILVGCAPVWIRNLLVGVPMFRITSVGPVTIANSNHVAYPGFGWAEDPASLTILARLLPDHHGSTLGAWLAAVDTHPGIGSYLALLWSKLLLALSWAEFPNNVNYYFTQLHAPILAWAPVTFTVVLVAAAVGLIGAIAQRRVPGPLLVFALLSLAQLVAFYNLGRFRVALIAALLPLAGWGVWWLAGLLYRRQWRPAVPVLLVAAALAALVQRPLPDGMLLIGSGPYGNALNHYYRPQWRQATAAGDWRRALQVVEQAIRTRPDYLDGLRRSAPPDTRSKLNATAIYAELYENYARALQQNQRPTEAQAALQRADELARTHEFVQSQLQRNR